MPLDVGHPRKLARVEIALRADPRQQEHRRCDRPGIEIFENVRPELPQPALLGVGEAGQLVGLPAQQPPAPVFDGVHTLARPRQLFRDRRLE